MTLPATLVLLTASFFPQSGRWNDSVLPTKEKPEPELSITRPHPRSEVIYFDAPPHSGSILFRR